MARIKVHELRNKSKSELLSQLKDIGGRAPASCLHPLFVPQPLPSSSNRKILTEFNSTIHTTKLSMVQLMSSKKPSIKLEIEVDECLENQLGPLHKRCKVDSLEMIPSVSSLYDPLDEPSPLGLRLKKSPSFLDLIQMKLSQENNTKKNQRVACGNSAVTAVDKLKASNFPASLLKIGNWEYKSRYEGDLVGKFYFAKHKLIPEVLDGGL